MMRLTYDDFYRTGLQDCANAISLDEFEGDGTPAQVVDRVWRLWEDEYDIEARWLAQQDDFEGLNPHRAYERWRDGWKSCAVEILDRYQRGERDNPARSAKTEIAAIEKMLTRSSALRGGTGDRARMAIKSGEMSEPEHGRFRVTFFGPDGPHGHATRNTEREIVREIWMALPAPVFPMSDDEVIEWTSTAEFEKGSKLTAYVQAENALRWHAGKAGKYAWAHEVIERANDLGTRHGSVNTRGAPYDSSALDDAIAMLSAALRELPETNPPRKSIMAVPIPQREQPCYRTKREMIRKFLDVNSDIVQSYGGADYEVSPAEFDAINHKYGLTGRRAVRTIADAVWAAMPVGKPYCLDRLDLDALNDTSPAREAGVPFRLPDVVYETELAREYARHYAEAPEPAWITEMESAEAPRFAPPSEFMPYHLELEEQEPGVARYQIADLPQVMRRPATAPRPASRGASISRVTAPPPQQRTVPRPADIRPYRLTLEEEEPGMAKYSINPAKSGDFRVVVTDRTGYSMENTEKVFTRDDYRTALRDAVAELLGTGGDHADIFWKNTLVAEADLQHKPTHGGMKVSVRLVGEKPVPLTHDQPKQNPAWVTNILSKHLVELEESIPAKWLPKLTKTSAYYGRISAALKEHGCGSYGCVLPTMDPKVVLKLTTDDTEAQFANELADTLAAPIVVKYHLTLALPEKYKGRKSFLLWRDSADRVGELGEVVAERGGDGVKAEQAIEAQHAAADRAFKALDRGEDATALLEKWERKAREMGEKVPELRELAEGMITNLHAKGIFMGDVHGGNIGRVEDRWVVIDPGHIAVVER